MNKLYIVGFGVGNEEILTTKAKNIIEISENILSTSRISKANKKIKCCTLSEIEEELYKNNSKSTVLLVSGDVCFFSISKIVINKFSESYDIELINGISSIQYLCSKIKVNYDDGIIRSVHGRQAQIVPLVSYNKKVFLLSGGKYKAHHICEELYKYGLRDIKVTVGENLSYENERIITSSPKQLKDEEFSDLAVLYIENNNAINPHIPLKDDDFIRGEVPMTKEEVRWISLNKLSIDPSDIIYDIGAGTGSVSVEMARRAKNSFVYAVEMKKEALDLIEKNKVKHGAYNIEIINAKAPDKMSYLPAPNKAFIGGSAGNMEEIIGFLIKKNPKIRIVINLITLQNLNKVLNCFEKYEFSYDVTCVNISKSKKIGSYDMMMSENPVYIVCGEKNE